MSEQIIYFSNFTYDGINFHCNTCKSKGLIHNVRVVINAYISFDIENKKLVDADMDNIAIINNQTRLICEHCRMSELVDDKINIKKINYKYFIEFK